MLILRLILLGGLVASVGCGSDCNSAPDDCDFGEACVDGQCVNVFTGQACTIDSDCNANGADEIVCRSRQCQIRIPRVPPPPITSPDASVGDGGDAGGP